MEWSELLPEDRRQLRALLNLDENGLPLAKPSLPNDPTESNSSTTAEKSSSNTSTDAVTVTYSQIRELAQIEIAKALPYWRAVCDMEAEAGSAPVIAEQSLRISEVVPCSVFRDFLCVMVQSKLSLEATQTKKSATRGKGRPLKRGRPITRQFTFETMHFAHKTDLSKGYEVQSVHIPGQPLALQCVAGDLLSVGLVASLFARGQQDEISDVISCFPSSVAVYGMGGNVIPMALAELLPPGSVTHVVEIEPAVVALCTMQGRMPAGVVCHVCGMEEAMEKQMAGLVDLAIVDCFDPNVCTMLHQETVLRLVKDKVLRPGRGVAIINAHFAPTAEKLVPFVRVFGSQHVLAVSVPGVAQCAIACSVVPFTKQNIGPECWSAAASQLERTAAEQIGKKGSGKQHSPADGYRVSVQVSAVHALTVDGVENAAFLCDTLDQQ